MSQKVFRFVDVQTAQKHLLRAVDDAVGSLGLGVAAGAVGLKDAQLRDMIDGRGGRRLSPDIAAVIASRVGDGALRDAILEAVRELFGLHQPEDDVNFIHRLKGALLRFGEPGAEMLRQCRKEARRG